MPVILHGVQAPASLHPAVVLAGHNEAVHIISIAQSGSDPLTSSQLMAVDDTKCPTCGEPIQYWKYQCRNKHFLAFPNYRAAFAQRDELVNRYRTAQEDCRERGVTTLLESIEAVAAKARPVIAMSFSACDDILRPDKYRNYHQRIESGEREPAGQEDHSARVMVGERLFPAYGEYIQYAALSADGRGLATYGPVAVQWDVTAEYLGRRASLLDENSYLFYDHYGLGDRKAKVPTGHQAVWEDRTLLVAAKIGPRLTTATPSTALAALLVVPGETRNEDDFVEIAIYADEGLDTRDVNRVTLQRPAKDREEGHRRELIREVCVNRGIAFIE